MQMSSLAVQLELKDSQDLLPVGIALVTFMQYLGSSVLQVIAGAIFNSELKSQLTSTAGLSPAQMEVLLGAGTSNVWEWATQNVPQRLRPIIEAYNSAITRVFVRCLLFPGIC